MHLEQVYEVNADGVMVLAGHDVRDLLREFGSPLMVVLEDVIRFNCRAYRKSVERYPRTRVYYASKALLTVGLCKLFEQEGLGLDVVSAGELVTAFAAGFPPERILLHGNAKTEAELRMALEHRVGRIVIDNPDEIGVLARLTAELDCDAQVFLRVTPGIKPSTHRYVQTGQVDSKFGFNLEGGAAHAAARRILATPRLNLVGLHCHIGSQIFASKPFGIAAWTMMGFYAELKKELGAELDELNMGGGLGIRYMPDDYPPSVVEHLENLRRVVLDSAEELGVDPPVLCDEPGRSIVGRAGVSLYTVVSTKCIPGVRNYASVDGGMSDNPRYALYEARHQVVVASRMNAAPEDLWSISGRCCESGDMLAKDVHLPGLEAGDLLALLSTGAYTYSMASNYNRIARPAVVLAAPGRVDLLCARETPEDLIRLDRVPAWLDTPARDGGK
jgi:diaminopimelate decarboxylase